MSMLSYFQPIRLLFIIAFAFTWSSCDKNKEEGSDYDPSRPVVLAKFYPESGGYATKVIISGENFGTDTSKIKVYFNEKKASIVGTNGEQLYVVVPKLPGEICTVKVDVDGKSQSFKETFQYASSYTITTVAGKYGGTATTMIDGNLAETEFNDRLAFLVTDTEGNLFGTKHGSGQLIFMLNEDKNISKKLLVVNSAQGDPQVPTINPANGKIYVPSAANSWYYEFDPELQWSSRQQQILNPTDADKNFTPIDWKLSLAFNQEDGYVYTRSWLGEFVRFNPKTRVGELVASPKTAGVLPDPLFVDMDSYHVFDPNNQDIIYVAYQPRHCIYSFNIKTLEHKLIAGTSGVAGYNDGPATNAEFNNPRQMTVDSDGNIYVADAGNHCIRKISNGMVTTVVGQGGVSGYVDGSADEALLNNPWGVAVDKNDDVYVADRGNRVIRKLSFK